MGKLAMVIMAAGIGSRYGGLKQVDPVGPNGEIIIDYSLYDAWRAGIEQVVFIIRPDLEQVFKEKIGFEAEKHFKVSYVFQEIESGLPAGFKIPAGRRKPWEPVRLSCSASPSFPAIFWSLMPMIFMAMRPLKSWPIT